MLSKKDPEKPVTLIITTICGGGHLQTAKAMKGLIEANQPEARVIEIDIFNDWFGKYLGAFFTQCWNQPLRKGQNLILLAYAYLGIPLADPILFLPIFIQSFLTFYRLPVTRIIDTQPVGNCATTLAVYLTNKLKKKQLKIEKILTEIPTALAFHFYHPLKLLPTALRNLIEFQVASPLPEQADFFFKHAKLNSWQIKTIQPPLRHAFFEKEALSDPHLTLHFSSEREKEEVLRIGQLHSLITCEQPLSCQIHLDAKIHLTTIMLGSQPQIRLQIAYLDKLYQLALKEGLKKHHVIIVLGNHRIEKWKSLIEIWLERPPIKFFHPVLLTAQPEGTVAKLLKRSHRTITRSGGLTAMELLQSEQQHALIHTDTIRKNQPVLKKMPPWEIGNAQVLMKTLGARITNPDYLEELE
jgi:hypothetical protein